MISDFIRYEYTPGDDTVFNRFAIISVALDGVVVEIYTKGDENPYEFRYSSEGDAARDFEKFTRELLW